MYCVAIGDVFITKEMMQKSIEKYNDMIDEANYFFFGTLNRKEMRDVVKTLEAGGRDCFELPEELLKEFERAEILMVHLCPITEKVLQRAKKLKYILCNRGGIENIDVEAAAIKNIAVFNNPAHNANAVAEFTIGLMLCETRNIARSYFGIKRGEWREKYPNSNTIIEMKDLTIGIIGFGNVGKLVCEKLMGFQCQILVSHLSIPDTSSPRIDWNRVHFVELDELLEKSDIVSLHARTAKKNIILGAQEFERMKPTSYFINTSRSYMVDYKALYQALLKQEIRGAAIDVFEVEPLKSSEPLVALDNVTLTNHKGGDTLNAYADSPEMMLSDLKKYISEEKK